MSGWMRRGSPRLSPIWPGVSATVSSSPARAISTRAPRWARSPTRSAASEPRCALARTARGSGRRPDSIVDCRGFAARAELKQLRGVRGEMIRVRTREVSFTRAVRLLHPRIPLYVVPRANGEFMIGATMIESAEKGAVSVRSAIELLSAAYALHPAFGEAEILEMSADVRPAFPDNEPRIDERGGRIFVNGFYRHGFLLAPAFAERAAALAFERAEALV